MSATPIYRGVIPEGGLFPSFDEASFDALEAWCKLHAGSRIEMTIREEGKNRSLNQNAYYWGVIIKMIADHAGYSSREEIESVHYELARMFLTCTKHCMGGKDIEVIRSTADLSTVEAEEYYSKIRMWAAIAIPLDIPEPNECEIPEYYVKGA